MQVHDMHSPIHTHTLQVGRKIVLGKVAEESRDMLLTNRNPPK